MQAIIYAALSWLVRGALVKSMATAAIFGLVAILVPIAISFITPFINTTFLTQAFQVVSPSVWYFLDLIRLDFGLPLIISAAVTRFLIRRLPVIG